MVLMVPLEAGIESRRVEVKLRTRRMDVHNNGRLSLEGVVVEIGG